MGFLIFLGFVWAYITVFLFLPFIFKVITPSVYIAWGVFLPITLLIFVVKNGIKGIIDVCKGE